MRRAPARDATPFLSNGGRRAKSLVTQSTFPHCMPGGIEFFLTFVTRGLPIRKLTPYNPPIAEERGAKRRQTSKQASEIKCKFWFQVFEFRLLTKNENRVLTDENVSNTTRQR